MRTAELSWRRCGGQCRRLRGRRPSGRHRGGILLTKQYGPSVGQYCLVSIDQVVLTVLLGQ